MPDWVFWLIVAAVLAAGEVATLGVLPRPRAGGPPAGGRRGAAGGRGVQLIVFIVGSVASLAFIRPIARRHLHTPPAIRTGTAALIGARRPCSSGWTRTAAG